MEYGYRKQLNEPFDEVVARTKAALQNFGFGVLTEVDVKETLRRKLGVEHGNYVILGACNPPLAYDALQSEKEIGLLLPCNVIVYQDGEQVTISAIEPTVAMKMIDNPQLQDIAMSVEKK